MFDAQTDTVAVRSSPRMRRFFDTLARLLRSVTMRRRERSLHIAETLTLGDKRFLAIVECERKRMLIGVTTHSITLLEQWTSPAMPAKNQDPRLETSFLHGVH